ncbi:hypothetical protein Pan216_08370 [Planctomycetes bacterium Pan216]|uniref:Uncharacterized protein n=1 Tax=Kolteria novifilia TaxID=2527975 RepID=A0A518AZ67_9BACT|nr:hypothetical protein Pan216_08370 [Planctomycetes bacterium Pan216]
MSISNPVDFGFDGTPPPPENYSGLRMFQLGVEGWAEVDMPGEGIVELQLSVAYSHATTLTFSILAPQHTLPIAPRTAIKLIDEAFDESEDRPIFEGWVHDISPSESNRVDYTCYDATKRAADEVFVFSLPYTRSHRVPRLVYNVKIEEDEDKAFERNNSASIAEIVKDLLNDPIDELREILAAPDEDSSSSSEEKAYDEDDLAELTYEPQEKVVFESETLRSALDRTLSHYPRYRYLFHPGEHERKWRLRDVKAAPQVTFTLNDPNATPQVLSLVLERSIEQRFTAVTIYGPQALSSAVAYQDDLDSNGCDSSEETPFLCVTLKRLWTDQEQDSFLQNGPSGSNFFDTEVGSVFRRWQIEEEEYRQMGRRLRDPIFVGMFSPNIFGSGLAKRTTIKPSLQARWDDAVGWENLNGWFIENAANGVIQVPYHAVKSFPAAASVSVSSSSSAENFSTDRDPITFPADESILPIGVRLYYTYYGEPLKVRKPASGFEGTAYERYGIQNEMHRYDEFLATGYDRGSPVTDDERKGKFERIAEQILEGHKDVVYSGGCSLHGIHYDFLRLNKRVNFTGLDGEGNPETLDWEDINAIVTDVEFDYAENLTTLTFSSDHLEFTQVDPEQLKKRLKIPASQFVIESDEGFIPFIEIDGRRYIVSLSGKNEGNSAAENKRRNDLDRLQRERFKRGLD